MGIREAGIGGVAGAAVGAGSRAVTLAATGAAVTGGALLPFALLGGSLSFLAGLFSSRPKEVGNQRPDIPPLRAVKGPAHHIYGRKRTHGREIDRIRAGNSLWRPKVISVGACEGVETVYVDKNKVALKRESEIVTTPPPGMLGQGKSLGARITGSGNYRIDFNIDVPPAEFRPTVVDPRLIRLTWIPGDIFAESIQLFFRDGPGGHPGSGPGPHLRNEGQYGVVVRAEGRTEHFTIPPTDLNEPYILFSTADQRRWLADFGRRITTFEIALIDDAKWLDDVDYSEAFNNRYRRYTGALLPDSDLFEKGDRSKVLFKVWQYFKADGTEGAELREASRIADEEQESLDGDEETAETEQRLEPIYKWTTDHKVEGNSWLVFEQRQIDELWPEETVLPEVEYLVKGKKIRYPGQREPVWSDNAAAVIYHHLTEVMGIDDSKVDKASFVRAIGICERAIRYRLSASLAGDSYEQVSKMFSINGVFREDEDLKRVMEEMLFACVGNLSTEDDSYSLTVGPGHLDGEEPPREGPVTLFDETNIIGIPVRRWPKNRDNPVVGVKATLGQSRDHDYQETEMRAARLPGAVGQVLDVGTRGFVSDPLQMGRLLVWALRRELASERLDMVVEPGLRKENYALRLGHLARVKHQAINENGGIWMIEQIQPNDGETLRLLLSPDLDWRIGHVSPPPKTVSGVRSDGINAANPDIVDDGTRFEI